MKEKFSIYDMVTSRILDMMDKGIIPWVRPWTIDTLAISRATGKPYSMMNQLLLSPNFDGTLESLNNGEFATYKQISDEGGHLKKDSKAYKIVFWKHLTIKETNDEGEEVIKSVPLLRYYNVFDIRDADLEPKHKRERTVFAQPCEEAERILDTYWTVEGIAVKNKGASDRAFYRPATDTIVLPKIEQFEDSAEYYSTAFHESVHSTGHKSRLNRLKMVAEFGSEDYSKEELIAEIGASALVSLVGIETQSSFKNNAAYIQNWRNAIAQDNKLIISATGKAEKAVDRILNPQPKTI